MNSWKTTADTSLLDMLFFLHENLDVIPADVPESNAGEKLEEKIPGQPCNLKPELDSLDGSFQPWRQPM